MALSVPVEREAQPQVLRVLSIFLGGILTLCLTAEMLFYELYRAMTLGAMPLILGMWGVAGLMWFVMVIALAVSRRPRLLVVVVGGGLLSVLLAVAGYREAFPERVHAELHRDDLDEISRLYDSGALGNPNRWSNGEAQLPSDVRDVSVTGAVEVATPMVPDWPSPKAPPVPFVPLTLGLLDGGMGLARLGDTSPRGVDYFALSDELTPMRHVGHGWWLLV
jgi:hypothetical protein